MAKTDSPPVGTVEVAEAREELEDTVREALGKAWRMALAYLASDLADGGAPLGYPEDVPETEKVLAAAEAYAADEVAAALAIAHVMTTVPPGIHAVLLERAQDALAFERERADKAEAELAALAGSTGTLIATAADAKLGRIRATVENFLAEYGTSEIPMFKVGQDLANSVMKILGPADGEAPHA